MWTEFLKSAAALALILGIIFFLAYLTRRIQASRGTGAYSVNGWRILSVKSLGPRRQVFIIEVGKRILVIGATDRMMTTLSEITDEDERAALVGTEQNKSPRKLSFSDILRKAEV